MNGKNIEGESQYYNESLVYSLPLCIMLTQNKKAEKTQRNK